MWGAFLVRPGACAVRGHFDTDTPRTPGQRAGIVPKGAPDGGGGYLPDSASTIAGSSARNACPRWLMAFFSSGLSSAQLRSSPLGCSTGS